MSNFVSGFSPLNINFQSIISTLNLAAVCFLVDISFYNYTEIYLVITI